MHILYLVWKISLATKPKPKHQAYVGSIPTWAYLITIIRRNGNKTRSVFFITLKGGKPMLTYKKEYEHYVVYVNGKFLQTCYNYNELREICREYGVYI